MLFDQEVLDLAACLMVGRIEQAVEARLRAFGVRSDERMAPLDQVARGQQVGVQAEQVAGAGLDEMAPEAVDRIIGPS